MKTRTIAVTGATGNIGQKLVNRLLAQGATVKVIGRDAKKLQPLVKQGAVAHVGSVDDAEFLTQVFTGSDAVFALIPPEYTADDFRGRQNIVGDAIAHAIKASGVKHVVNLSSLGAEQSSGVGPIKGLYDQEQRLNKIPGLALVHLRPTYFFENLLFGLELITKQKIFGTAINGDVAFPQVATADIAEVAATHLLAKPLTGIQVVEILGERDVTQNEVTKAIAKASNISELHYVTFGYEDTRKALIGSGLSADVADQFVELYDAYNQKRIHSLTGRTKANTTRTSIENFTEQLKGVLQ